MNSQASAEKQFISVYFTPDPESLKYCENLGVLGRMAKTVALFEPFRNPITASEIYSCLQKLSGAIAQVEAKAKKRKLPIKEIEIPHLWILAATASPALLEEFYAIPDEENWGSGVYFLRDHPLAAIVAIERLPLTPETLWLRLLGRGRVQEEAIAELFALPESHPFRAKALELLYRLKSDLEAYTIEPLPAEDRELVMAIAPLFQQELATAREEGRQLEQHSILENFWRGRFGELAPEVTALIAEITLLPAVEFTALLLELSNLSVNEQGKEQAVSLLERVRNR